MYLLHNKIAKDKILYNSMYTVYDIYNNFNKSNNYYNYMSDYNTLTYSVPIDSLPSSAGSS